MVARLVADPLLGRRASKRHLPGQPNAQTHNSITHFDIQRVPPVSNYIHTAPSVESLAALAPFGSPAPSQAALVLAGAARIDAEASAGLNYRVASTA